MSKYSYRYLDTPSEDLLNEWGAEDWEIVGVISPYNAASGFTVILMKESVFV